MREAGWRVEGGSGAARGADADAKASKWRRRPPSINHLNVVASTGTKVQVCKMYQNVDMRAPGHVCISVQWYGGTVT